MIEPHEAPDAATGAPRRAWVLLVLITLLNTVGMVAGFLYTAAGHSSPYWLGAAMIVAAAVVFGRTGIRSPARAAGDG